MEQKKPPQVKSQEKYGVCFKMSKGEEKKLAKVDIGYFRENLGFIIKCCRAAGYFDRFCLHFKEIEGP